MHESNSLRIARTLYLLDEADFFRGMVLFACHVLIRIESIGDPVILVRDVLVFADQKWLPSISLWPL